MKQLIHILFILCFVTEGLAQVAQDKRVEIEMEHSDNNYAVIPAGKDGVFMYRENDQNHRDDEKTWEFRFYDTEFEEVWQKKHSFSKDMVMSSSFSDGEKLYILFKIKNKKDIYQLVTVTFSYKDMEVEQHALILPPKYRFFNFRVVNNYIYFDGVLKRVACVGAGSLQTDNVKIIANPHFKRANINQVQTDYEGKAIDIVYQVIKKKKPVSLQVDHVMEDNVQNSLLLAPGNDNNLYSVRLTRLPDGKKIAVGTFGFKKSRGSEGMFFSRIGTDDQPEYIKYYDFIRFQNLFSDLSEKKQAKLEKKIAKNDSKGKETRLNLNLLLHKIIEYNNEYICVGEVYYATYRTETYYCGTTANGMPMYCTRQVFDGWMYSKAIITAFDKEGNLVWDNILEMGDIKSWTLREKVRVSFENNTVVLVYGTSQTIKTKIIEGNKVVEGKNNTTMTTNFASDKVKWSNMEVSYWYDNYFLTWGSQKIKNKDKKENGKKNRYVFFFNRVAY